MRDGLGRPLPGREAHLRLATRPRIALAPIARHHPQPAAVLILMYPLDGDLHLPLTRRTETVATHKGQISWPGGVQEEGEPLVTTALRESEEELGIEPTAVDVLGELTPLPTGSSGYLVTPLVGWTPTRPTFRPNPQEVAEILEVRLDTLRRPAILREEVWDLRGRETLVPCYRLGPGTAIWGATAMTLGEFLEVVEAQLGAGRVESDRGALGSSSAHLEASQRS